MKPAAYARDAGRFILRLTVFDDGDRQAETAVQFEVVAPAAFEQQLRSC